MIGKTVVVLEILPSQIGHIGKGCGRLRGAGVAVAQVFRRAGPTASFLTRECRKRGIARGVGRKGDRRQRMQSGFPKGHDGEKGAVHHGEAILTQRIVDFAEDNLAKLIFNAKFLISQHPQNLIGGSVGGV